ncbi:MAG: M48 family metalloprotease [Rubripirellula sp.]
MEALAKEPAARIGNTAASTIEQMGIGAGAILSGSVQKDDESAENNVSAANASGDKSQASSLSTGNLISDLFKVGRETAKSIDNSLNDAFQLDAATKKKIGFELYQRIMIEKGVVDDPQVNKRVAAIAQPLLKHCGLEENEIRFTVLDSPEINAFAHVGGYVYLNEGLMNLHDDDELQFIVGHEMAHLVLGHCGKKLTYAARASEIGGDLGGNLASIAYQAVSIGYAQDDEFEADRFSYNQLDENKSAAIRSLKIIANALGDTDELSESNSPAAATFAEIDMHFRSHPPTQLRIERLKK